MSILTSAMANRAMANRAMAPDGASLARDLRACPMFREAETLLASLLGAGTGAIVDAAELHVAPDGKRAVFSGRSYASLETPSLSRICEINLASRGLHSLTEGAHNDRCPRYSPDGGTIAFLSDRHAASDYQLYFLDCASRAVRAAPHVEGWAEYLHWSPDGTRLLLGAAGHGAALASAQGATASAAGQRAQPAPSWMPEVDAGVECHHRRCLWVYDIASGDLAPLGVSDDTVWEAAWCGDDAVAAILSAGPGESDWYGARLVFLDRATGAQRELHRPRHQLGWPAATPSGARLAFVEAVCSDRGIVAGEVYLIEPSTGATCKLDTGGIDVSWLHWRSDDRLLVGGYRGLETVIGECDAGSGIFRELWCSTELSSGSFGVAMAPIGDADDVLVLAEGFLRAPEIAVLGKAGYRTIHSFDQGYAARAAAMMRIEALSWPAPDGQMIEGWLLCPNQTAPHPLVLNIHGGPVSHWRPVWLGRGWAHLLMLISHGYAVFLPNPRGSTGRGRAFAAAVLGDMGGTDTLDFLSGLDFLVQQGLADPARLGVMGRSYGGFMSAWLVGQDSRFAAAISLSPATNLTSLALTSNIPHFVEVFVGGKYDEFQDRYAERSPVMYAHHVHTPMLIVTGARDLCTPPSEAIQFHHALQRHGATSVLINYPEEGHGVRQFPAVIDYSTRVLEWFRSHMPTDVVPAPTKLAAAKPLTARPLTARAAG